MNADFNTPIKSKRDKKYEILGKLIIVEGIDGSGKSTQIKLLEKWLRYNNYNVFFTEWNSSDLVRTITKRAKKKTRLTPITFSLLHATDFTDRYERKIYPLLRAGYIVLADRYIYTAFARDVVRGCESKWIGGIYDFAIKPDIAFYFKVPTEIAISRILSGRPKLKYYEAGLDLGLSDDPYESYKIFQGRIVEQYDSMVKPHKFEVIDGTLDIETQQRMVRSKVQRILPQSIKIHDGDN